MPRRTRTRGVAAPKRRIYGAGRTKIRDGFVWMERCDALAGRKAGGNSPCIAIAGMPPKVEVVRFTGSFEGLNGSGQRLPPLA